MLGSNKETIALSLTEEILQIVAVKGKGGSAKVSRVFAKNVKGLSGDELPKVIQSGLKGFNTRSAGVVSVVPPSGLTTKNIEIPSTNADEIKSIVNLQAGRHTPFSREEIQIGHINIGVYKNNYTKVLLVIANRNLLKEQMGVFEKAGLKVQSVLFAPEGVANIYAAAKPVKSAKGPVGIIDIGARTTEFIITFKNKVITSRTIPVGKSHLADEGTTAQERLVEELNKTIESYANEDIDKPPVAYALTGDDQRCKDIQQALKEKLGWNATLHPYTKTVKAGRSIRKQIEKDYGGQSFLPAIAAAAAVTDKSIDLMPEDLQLQKSIEDQGREVFKAAILSFIILILVACTFGLKLYFHKAYLSRLKEEYKGTRQEVRSLEERAQKTELLQEYLQSRMASLDTIHELYRYIPNEIYLTRITMQEDGAVNIEGISEVGSTVYSLNSQLKDSDLFESAEVISKTAKRDRGKDAHAFEIMLEFTAEEDDGTPPEEQQPQEEQ